MTLGTLLILIASGSQWQIDGAALGEISVGPAVVAMSFTFSLLYGHLGAATAIVAGRRRGRSTRRVCGGLAAGVLFVSVILAATVVLHRAIPPEGAVAPASFLDRLALLDNSAIALFASLYLVGQLSLQAIHTSLGITMLTRDWLTQSPTVDAPSWTATLPATAVVLFAGLSAQLDIGGYELALALSGVMLVPVLGGCVPILVRFREAPPTQYIGRSLVLGSTLIAFLIPTVSHGFVVWSGILHRSLIGLSLVAVAAILMESLRNSRVGQVR